MYVEISDSRLGNQSINLVSDLPKVELKKFSHDDIRHFILHCTCIVQSIDYSSSFLHMLSKAAKE